MLSVVRAAAAAAVKVASGDGGLLDASVVAAAIAAGASILGVVITAMLNRTNSRQHGHNTAKLDVVLRHVEDVKQDIAGVKIDVSEVKGTVDNVRSTVDFNHGVLISEVTNNSAFTGEMRARLAIVEHKIGIDQPATEGQ